MPDVNIYKQRAEQALQNCREARSEAEVEKKLAGDIERPPIREERRPANGEKFCPFSFSNPSGPISCTSACKLYRTEKVPKDYECLFQELRSNSWNTKEILKLIINFTRGR